MDAWQDEWAQPRRHGRRLMRGNNGGNQRRLLREPLLDSGNLYPRGSPRGDMELTSLYQPPLAVPMTQQMNRQQGTMNNKTAAGTLFGQGSLAQTRTRPCTSSYAGGRGSVGTFAAAPTTRSRLAPSTEAVETSVNPLCSHGGCCFPCVRTQEMAIVEQCGNFEQLVGPGLHVLPWPWVGVTARLSLRTQQLTVRLETNTSDPVFVHLQLAVQYRVAATRAYEAYYSVGPDEMEAYISSLVADQIRGRVPGIPLDDLFGSGDKDNSGRNAKILLTDPILDALFGPVLEQGYELLHVALTHVVPHSSVRQAMNEVAASRREKWAASHRAEAFKAQTVTAAQAHAERLQRLGVGTARQRHALVHQYFVESLHSWHNDVYMVPENLPSQQELLSLLLVAQYYDVLTSVSLKKKPQGTDDGASNSEHASSSPPSAQLLLAHDAFAPFLSSS